MPQRDSVENSRRLFLGSFLILLATGMGFSARGAVLGTWGAEFGFTKAELGVITGFGLTGFGLTGMFFSGLVEGWGRSGACRRALRCSRWGMALRKPPSIR